MEKPKDKMEITISLERQLNGTVATGVKYEGSGFHIFELVGLLQMISYDLAAHSKATAKALPKDKKARIILTNKQQHDDKH